MPDTGDLTVAAHRLSNGEWILMGFDGVDLKALRGEVVTQLLEALRDLPGSS